jgi:predicted metalloendopeptidase
MKLAARLLLAIALWAVIPFQLGAQSVPAGETPFAPPETSAGCDTFVSVPDDSASHGFNLANLDRSVQPCDDFFHFADGGWIKSNPIPPQYPSWGVASKLAEDNREKLHQILETAAKNTNAPAGSVDQKIGDFYSSCMNEAQIEKAGVQPLQDEFNRIEKIAGVAGLQAEIARLHGFGVHALFGFGSELDAKDSTQTIAFASQGGLGLPDRDYYLKTDPKSQQTRDAYVQHVQKMFELLGDDAAKAAGETKTVMEIETRLAKASMTRVEQRDPDKTYHKMNLSELAAMTPNFSWTSYFQEVGFPTIDTVDVGQPDFFKEVNSDLAGTPMAHWKVYLRWNLINASAESLSAQFVEEDFNFYEKNPDGLGGNSTPVATMRSLDRSLPWRGSRPNLREGLFPARSEGPRSRDGAQPDGGIARRHRNAGLDERRDAQTGACETRCIPTENRVPRRVARLFGI